MSVHTITLQLPETLYEHFWRRTQVTHRSLETEVLDVVASAATVENELSTELLEGIAALEELGDEGLWRLAREAMSQNARQELEALHSKQRDEGLSQEEDARRARLIHEYERTMLTRAQAASLLKDRGHDVSTIVASR
jgi:hypothetical protein